MSTVRQLKAESHTVTLYCVSREGAFCTHSWKPSYDQLAQVLGWDFDFIRDRQTLNTRFVCEVCGGRGATVIVTPSQGWGGKGGHANKPPVMTVDQSAEAERLRTAERRFYGLKTNAEMTQESNAARRAAAKVEQDKAILIGPPNPFKRGRR